MNGVNNAENRYLICSYLHKTEKAITEAVAVLGNKEMKPLSHGYEKYPDLTILAAARNQAEEFLEQKVRNNAAINMMAVILAANRSYQTHVEPRVRIMYEKFPAITISELKDMLSSMDFIQFRQVWGHKDEKKYNTLKSLINKIIAFKSEHDDDSETMKKWAAAANVASRKTDPLGSLPNVGIATFQHLRMTFGVDTVKPDQRVKEVLDREFGAKLSDEKVILAVEEIAQITGFKVIEVDQIFVKYGSGYYGDSSNLDNKHGRQRQGSTVSAVIPDVSKVFDISKQDRKRKNRMKHPDGAVLFRDDRQVWVGYAEGRIVCTKSTSDKVLDFLRLKHGLAGEIIDTN